MDIGSPAPPNPKLNISRPPRWLYSGKRERVTEVDNVITSVGKRLTEMTETLVEDKHDVFGRNLAHKLRNLPNDQRIYLEKLINEGIFEAELGNLTKYCSIHIPTIQQQHPNMENSSSLTNTSVLQSAEMINLDYNSQGGFITNNNSDVPGFINLDTPRNIKNYLTTFKP